MKKMFVKFLFISYLFLFAGLGLLGLSLYSKFSAENGGGIPAENSLQSASGTAVEGREMTIETKRRRGIDSKEVFFEIDLKDNSGKILKLRLDHRLPRAKIESLLGQNIQVKYDASDENRTFQVEQNNQVIIAYQDLAKIYQAEADKRSEMFNNDGMYKASITWIILGAIGVFFRRRMLAQLQPNN